MESQQPQRQAAAAASEVDVDGGKGASSGGSSGGMGCNKQCSRWTPTTEQIRILKDLYYNNGVRSPSAEQIQRISARLRQYGKIEGKNVFYWFQNHKARERQKKRFTVEQPHHVPTLPPPPMQVQIAGNGGNYCWPRPEQDSMFQINKCQPLCATGGVSSSGQHHGSSPGLFGVGVGQNFGSFGGTSYGSGTVKNFRDRSISSSAGGSGIGGCISNNFKWVGIDPYASSYAPFDTRNLQPSPFELNNHHQQHQVPQAPVQEYQEEQEDDEDDDDEEDENDDVEDEEESHHPEIQTLPLFPVHGDSINKFNSDRSTAATYDATIHGGSGLASLELSLCSLAGRSNST